MLKKKIIEGINFFGIFNTVAVFAYLQMNDIHFHTKDVWDIFEEIYDDYKEMPTFYPADEDYRPSEQSITLIGNYPSLMLKYRKKRFEANDLIYYPNNKSLT